MARTLSVEEAAAILKNCHIDLEDDGIRRSLYFGLIQGQSPEHSPEYSPEQSRFNWEISDYELLKLMNAILQEQNEQLKREICELKKKNCILWKENHELRISIGLK